MLIVIQINIETPRTIHTFILNLKKAITMQTTNTSYFKSQLRNNQNMLTLKVEKLINTGNVIEVASECVI